MAGGKKGRDGDGDFLTGVSESVVRRVNPTVIVDHLAETKPRKPRVRTGKSGALPKSPKIG